MTAFLAFVTANAAIILGVAYALINLLVAVFNKNEKFVGILGVIRSILERISALQPKNAEGTVKVPLVKAGPTKVI